MDGSVYGEVKSFNAATVTTDIVNIPIFPAVAVAASIVMVGITLLLYKR